jgi:hypothetical protein
MRRIQKRNKYLGSVIFYLYLLLKAEIFYLIKKKKYMSGVHSIYHLKIQSKHAKINNSAKKIL